MMMEGLRYQLLASRIANVPLTDTFQKLSCFTNIKITQQRRRQCSVNHKTGVACPPELALHMPLVAASNR